MLMGFSAPMPKDFPQVRNWSGFRFTRSPMLMFANGELRVGPNTTQFSSLPPQPAYFVEWLNLDWDLEFSLAPSAVRSIGRHSQPGTAVHKYYSYDWIRIQTDEDLLGGDFLLHVGNYGLRTGDMKKQTDERLETLTSLPVAGGANAQATHHLHHQRRARRSRRRAPLDAPRDGPRGSALHRREGRLRHRRLRRLLDDRRRPPRHLVPHARGAGRRPRSREHRRASRRTAPCTRSSRRSSIPAASSAASARPA